jgi:protein FAM50
MGKSQCGRLDRCERERDCASRKSTMCIAFCHANPTQHYEFYYFIANKIQDPSGANGLLFNYANTAETKSQGEEPVLLRRPGEEKFEGQDHDPAMTKVVDRRWYEKNKHIYPATLWKEYEVGKEFAEKMSNMRRDGEGNSFFYS